MDMTNLVTIHNIHIIPAAELNEPQQILQEEQR
jgi:hypothetical protein